jgi:hypothetical protein
VRDSNQVTGNAGSRPLRLGPTRAVRRRMNARTRVPVAAIIGALVLNASAAHGQAVSPDLPASSDEPQVSVPPASGDPPVSIPKPGPGPEPKPAGLESLRQAADPESPPAGATPYVPSAPAPQMIHEARSGFVLGGLLVIVPGFLLWTAVSVGSGIDCKTNCGFSTGDALTLGVIGATGGTLLIIGLIGHDVPSPTPQGRNLAFLPFVTPKAEGLSMAMRW